MDITFVKQLIRDSKVRLRTIIKEKREELEKYPGSWEHGIVMYHDGRYQELSDLISMLETLVLIEEHGVDIIKE